MFKIFRNIRGKSLSEGKIRKYLIYALGEIILVMIGILLALRVNSWNQDRINNNTQEQYLYRVQLDINKDVENLINLKDRNQERINKVNRFIEYFGEKHIEKDTFNNLYWSTHHSDDFIEADDTYMDMVNSAKLDLIKNDSIKIKIIDLYSHYNMINQYEKHIQTDNRENIYQLSIKLFDWHVVVNSKNQEEFEIEFQKISSNLQIKNAYVLFSSVAWKLTELYNTGIIKIKELDNAITNELDSE